MCNNTLVILSNKIILKNDFSFVTNPTFHMNTPHNYVVIVYYELWFLNLCIDNRFVNI